MNQNTEWPEKLYARLPDPLPKGWQGSPFLSKFSGGAANEGDKAERVYVPASHSDVLVEALRELVGAAWEADCAIEGLDSKGECGATQRRLQGAMKSGRSALGQYRTGGGRS